MNYRFKYNPKENSLFEISPIKYYTGIVLGSLFAFFLYAFGYMIREVMRALSFSKTYGIWKLTEDDHQFYNLSFAFIAVAIGQSICFKYWFDTPKKTYNKSSFRKSSLVNDQSFLQWGFLAWFSKMSFLFVFLFGMTFEAGYKAIDMHKEYSYLFTLFALVLFFQSWIHIRKYFKSHSLKWMASSLLILSCLSFGLSKIELIDYKAIDEIARENAIFPKYNLQLVESEFHEKLRRKTHSIEVYIVNKKSNIDQAKPIILMGNKAFEMEDFPAEINKILYPFDNQNNYFLYCLLIADPKTPMSFIIELEEVLSLKGINRYAYQVRSTGNEQNTFFEHKYLRRRAPSSLEFYHATITTDNKLRDTIEISLDKNDKCFINENNITKGSLKQQVKDFILKQPDGIIQLNKRDNNNFQQYIWLYSTCRKAMNEIRDDSAQELFAKDYNQLEQKNKKMIRNKHPLYLMEMSNYLLKQMEFYDKFPPPVMP